MNIDSKLRGLAQSTYWQNIFSASKDANGIHLFDNVTNFSGLQARFLYWLTIYAGLYKQLDTFESNYLTEDVLKDEDRTDAYLLYTKKKNEYEWKKYRQEERKQNRSSKRSKGNAIPINVDLRSE